MHYIAMQQDTHPRLYIGLHRMESLLNQVIGKKKKPSAVLSVDYGATNKPFAHHALAL